MPETIRVEVAAAESAFAPLRMVLGGVGARADLSVEELDDLYLAAEQLFRAAIALEGAERYGVEMWLEGGELRLAAGPFTSRALRQRAKPDAPDAACLDLCRVLHATCDDVQVDEAGGAYRIILVKARGATP